MAIAFSPPIPYPTNLPTATQLSILSQLKHALIGHHARKLVVLAHPGALEQLVQLGGHHLRPDTHHPEVQVVNEAVTLLGTLSLRQSRRGHRAWDRSNTDHSSAVSAITATHQAQLALLSNQVHQTLLSALAYTTGDRGSSTASSSSSHVTVTATTLTPRDKLLESVLRSIKVVYSDLVECVGPGEWGDDLLSLTPISPYIKYAKRDQSESRNVDHSDDDSDDDGDDQTMDNDFRTGRASQSNLKRLAAKALSELYSPTSTALLGLAPMLDFDSSSLDPHSLRLRHKRAELVCDLFASTVRTQEQRQAVLQTGTTANKLWDSLVGIVTTTTGRVQESAIAALSALFKDETETLKACIGGQCRMWEWACKEVVADSIRVYLLIPAAQGGSPLFPTLNALSQSANASRRLTATIARIVLCQSRRLSITFPTPEFDRNAAGELGIDSVAATLMALVDADDKLRGRACFALAYLVAIKFSLETYGTSNNRVLEVVKKLLKSTSSLSTTTTTTTTLFDEAYYGPPPNSTPIEAALTLIALLTAESEDDRQLVKEKGLIPLIVEYLSHPLPKVKAAACHALRSLSRSVHLLRTSLVETEAAKPLVKLLGKGEGEVVRITAVATVSNLLLEFSPMRGTLIEEGVVEEIVAMAQEGSRGRKKNRAVGRRKRQEVKDVNVLWALKNASYQASYEFNTRLLALLGWPNLRTFLLSKQTSVSEQAFGILRNLTCTDGSNPTPALFAPPPSGSDTPSIRPEEVIKHCADVLELEKVPSEWPILEEAGVRLQVLYTLVNLAAGDMDMKGTILVQNGLLDLLIDALKAKLADVRCATVWVFINLSQPIPPPPNPIPPTHSTRPPKPHSSPTQPQSSSTTIAPLSTPPTMKEILVFLRNKGVNRALGELSTDVSLDVRERVKDALQVFSGWD
ncbi:BZ3500_MvSof-1268-A1-R1_Chr5-1g07587 [Microbotryum saponariae]|uniref:BZ3500_MvSof-1268-A1-R1_Chr5-1g07587 protein n=1 Tax=Microbotryum saponariae TaxID=289078 RepID=A0A2X0KJ12_9BASI|nr:BZ3500_MvSof-1268-A1-R1_Chr5-1g07587 [Microbotryum saponariae]SDA05458.1 BZ3501_MvSof-1269-A2-R1_Chr5-2g07411 [Microbotryum saponariae]